MSRNSDNPLEDYDLGPVLINGVYPATEGDTESDGALGARHVEHDLEVLLLRFSENTLDTELYLILNNPDAPVGHILIEPHNLNNTFYSFRVDKEQILPEWAHIYCIIKRPSGNPSKTKPLHLRVKRSRPAHPDPNLEAEGNQGLVFFLPADLEAGSHIDLARAERGVELEIHPWENQAEFDNARVAWGTQIVEHLVTADEVRRAFTMFIPPDVIKMEPHYPGTPCAMQVIDLAGNLPGDANSKSNWSEIQRVDVDLGVLRARPPFLEQAGEIVDLDELGGAAQIVQVFIDNNFFEKNDKMKLCWEGRDVQNVPFFHEEVREVNITNFIEDFEIPNDMVLAIAGGTAILYYLLYKNRDDEWLPSRKVRIRVLGEPGAWPAPTVPEASSGELSPESQATIEFKAQPGWTSATKIRLVMSAHGVNYTYEFFLGPIPDDKQFSHVVPSGEVARFNTLPAEVYYERIDLEPFRQSQRLSLHVGEPARTLPLVEIDKAWGNYLIPDTLDDYLDITIQDIDSLEGDIITLDFEGNNAETSVEVTVGEGQEGQPLYIPIEKRYVSENLNGAIQIKYNLARVGAPRRFSRISVYYVREAHDHITRFTNSSLNGWSYGAAVNDNRDKAFGYYGQDMIFVNWTYDEALDKSGVIFSQSFANIIPGMQYEFSIKARRIYHLYTLPNISLSSSGGPLVPPTLLQQGAPQELKGVITAQTHTLTLYINSHEPSGQGNDYAIHEIRFRLL